MSELISPMVPFDLHIDEAIVCVTKAQLHRRRKQSEPDDWGGNVQRQITEVGEIPHSVLF